MKTGEHELLFLEDIITKEHKLFFCSFVGDFIFCYYVLMSFNLYLEVVEELLDGGVEGCVVVEGVALWGAVDFCFAIFVSLNTDANEGATEPCGLRLRIGVSDYGYSGRCSDMVDVAMAIDRVEREGVGAKSRLETAREHKVFW